MLYIDIKEKVTRQDMIAEVRYNLRQVHNKYIQTKDFGSGEQAIDLFEYCHTEDNLLYAKLKPFIDIAVRVEGIEESFADYSLDEFKEALQQLIITLKEAMKGV